MYGGFWIFVFIMRCIGKLCRIFVNGLMSLIREIQRIIEYSRIEKHNQQERGVQEQEIFISPQELIQADGCSVISGIESKNVLLDVLPNMSASILLHTGGMKNALLTQKAGVNRFACGGLDPIKGLPVPQAAGVLVAGVQDENQKLLYEAFVACMLRYLMQTRQPHSMYDVYHCSLNTIVSQMKLYAQQYNDKVMEMTAASLGNAQSYLAFYFKQIGDNLSRLIAPHGVWFPDISIVSIDLRLLPGDLNSCLVLTKAIQATQKPIVFHDVRIKDSPFEYLLKNSVQQTIIAGADLAAMCGVDEKLFKDIVQGAASRTVFHQDGLSAALWEQSMGSYQKLQTVNTTTVSAGNGSSGQAQTVAVHKQQEAVIRQDQIRNLAMNECYTYHARTRLLRHGFIA